MLLTTLAWGVAFPVIKAGVAVLDPGLYVSYRFLAGALLLYVLVRPRFDAAAMRYGAICGAMLATGTVTQTISLVTTSATNSGFITGLSLVFLPLFQAVMERSWPPSRSWMAVLASLSGLLILTWNPSFQLNRGDIWAVACSLAFGAHLILLARFAPRADAIAMTVIQLGLTGLVGTLVALGSGVNFVLPPTQTCWLSLAFTTVFCSAGGFLAMTFVQRHLKAHVVALILLLEPVFAAASAAWMLNEPLSPRVLMGGALIVGAMAVAEW